MLGALIRTARKVCRKIAAFVETIVSRLAGLWRIHLDRVVRDPGYAAAVAALVAGGLGLMAAHDVLAAVVAGLLGVYIHGARDAGGAMRTTPAHFDY